MGQVGNNLVYANSGRHRILDELEQMSREINILISKDEKRASQIDEHRKHISFLECYLRQLLQNSEGYLLNRRRFLAVYKRDIKAMDELKGSKATQEGNVIAHGDDALGECCAVRSGSTYRQKHISGVLRLRSSASLGLPYVYGWYIQYAMPKADHMYRLCE